MRRHSTISLEGKLLTVSHLAFCTRFKCRAARQFGEQNFSVGLIFVSDEAQPQEEAAEGVLVIIHILVIGSDALLGFGHDTEPTDELGVGADFIRCGEACEPREGNLVVLDRDRQVLRAQRLLDESRFAFHQMLQVGDGLVGEAVLRHRNREAVRRFDFLGEYPLEPVNGKAGTAMLVDDYGHHPTEVDATIKAARAGWPDKNLVMLFQPHRFTRTRDLYDDFANVLTQVDALLMLDVYAAGEAAIPGADSRSLCRTIRGRGKIDPILVSDPAQVADMLAPVLTGNDLILVQGAGNIGKIARSLAEIKLKPQNPEEEQHG